MSQWVAKRAVKAASWRRWRRSRGWCRGLWWVGFRRNSSRGEAPRRKWRRGKCRKRRPEDCRTPTAPAEFGIIRRERYRWRHLRGGTRGCQSMPGILYNTRDKDVVLFSTIFITIIQSINHSRYTSLPIGEVTEKKVIEPTTVQTLKLLWTRLRPKEKPITSLWIWNGQEPRSLCNSFEHQE